MPTLTFDLEALGGPADGVVVRMRPGQTEYLRRDLSGVWSLYRVVVSDLGLSLEYRGPLVTPR